MSEQSGDSILLAVRRLFPRYGGVETTDAELLRRFLCPTA